MASGRQLWEEPRGSVWTAEFAEETVWGQRGGLDSWGATEALMEIQRPSQVSDMAVTTAPAQPQAWQGPVKGCWPDGCCQSVVLQQTHLLGTT